VDAQKAEKIIITVGTPFTEHIEMNLEHINEVLNAIIPVLRKNQTIVLRSTVAVGTTEFVKRRIESAKNWTVGHEFCLSFAPERILEGKMLEEMESIPQIIGVADEHSFESTSRLFRQITREIFCTSFRGAEMAKLFCNTGRYVYFALVNYFFMVANHFDTDIYELLNMINHNYPRPILYGPGLTAGPCLRKDFAMITELFPQADLFTAAWRVNESMPRVIVDKVKTLVQINGKMVAILGFTFKRDSDDVRDSLVPKLVRFILREVPEKLTICEPNLPREAVFDCGLGKLQNVSADEAVNGADIVIIANDHSYFKDNWQTIKQMIKPSALIVDIWNMTNQNQMFCFN